MPRLSHRHIFTFFLPLALSWVFMGFEAPIASSIMSRLPAQELNMAAWYMVFSLALWIESPVIDLLATSTTLSKNRGHYLGLTRFTQAMMLWTGLFHAVLVLTPLYGSIMNNLGYPAEVVAHGRLALIIMIPWSPLIGWRRYLQGILIRHKRTRMVGLGTAVRVCTLGFLGFLLYKFTYLPGVIVAATAIVCSVGAEALFAHIVSRSTIRDRFWEARDDEVLSFSRLARFHLPLTLTTMVTMLTYPSIGRALNAAPDSIRALAAWNVTMGLLFLFRSMTFALTEVVIALHDGHESARTLARFCFNTGAAATLVMVGMSLTGIDVMVITRLIGANQEVASDAHVAFLTASLTPLICAMQSYVRGMLTAYHLTVSRLAAVGVGYAVLVAMLVIGVFAGWPGLVNAGVAFTVSAAAELSALAYSWRRGLRRLAV